MFRHWLFVGVLAITMLTAASEAQMPLSKPPHRKQISETIEKQLAAFRANNWSAAYACSSKEFRRRFSEKAFVILMIRSYPQILKSVRADVGLVRDDGTSAEVPVRVFGENGAQMDYDYLLVKEKAGWGVVGVLPKAPAGPGT